MADDNNDPIGMLYDRLVSEHGRETEQLAGAVRQQADGLPAREKGMLYGRYVVGIVGDGEDDFDQNCKVSSDLEPIVAKTLQLRNRLMSDTTGNRCIPETFEADFVARVCRRAEDLSELEAGLLFGLTGVRPEELGILHVDAAEARAEAHRASYGEPADQL